MIGEFAGLWPVLFFDVETTGLPCFDLPAEHPSQPRIASIAGELIDKDGTVLEHYHTLIKPDGWTMPADASAVNGLTDAVLQESGVPILSALSAFMPLYDRAKLVCSYNIPFDTKMLRGELKRHGLPDRYDAPPTWCAMSAARALKIAGRKYKLGHVYESLFGEELGKAHDALVDMQALVRVAFHIAGFGNFYEDKIKHRRSIPRVQDIEARVTAQAAHPMPSSYSVMVVQPRVDGTGNTIQEEPIVKNTQQHLSNARSAGASFSTSEETRGAQMESDKCAGGIRNIPACIICECTEGALSVSGGNLYCENCWWGIVFIDGNAITCDQAREHYRSLVKVGKTTEADAFDQKFIAGLRKRNAATHALQQAVSNEIPTKREADPPVPSSGSLTVVWNGKNVTATEQQCKEYYEKLLLENRASEAAKFIRAFVEAKGRAQNGQRAEKLYNQNENTGRFSGNANAEVTPVQTTPAPSVTTPVASVRYAPARATSAAWTLNLPELAALREQYKHAKAAVDAANAYLDRIKALLGREIEPHRLAECRKHGEFRSSVSCDGTTFTSRHNWQSPMNKAEVAIFEQACAAQGIDAMKYVDSTYTVETSGGVLADDVASLVCKYATRLQVELPPEVPDSVLDALQAAGIKLQVVHKSARVLHDDYTMDPKVENAVRACPAVKAVQPVLYFSE